MRSLTIVTPVLPAAARYLPDAAHSVRAVEHHLQQHGWECEWVVVVDGPGALPRFPTSERTRLHRLPVQAGPAAARNRALAAARGDWLLPLDADDLLVPPGVGGLLRHPGLEQVAWVAANRVLLEDGARTAHWVPASRAWVPGQLAQEWEAPFPFAPGGVLVRRDAALAVGGWPAVPGCEDLGFALLLGEQFPGAQVMDVLTRHRVWEGQTSADSSWPARKKEAFATVEALVNARRALLGRPPVTAPDPGRAFGRLPLPQ